MRRSTRRALAAGGVVALSASALLSPASAATDSILPSVAASTVIGAPGVAGATIDGARAKKKKPTITVSRTSKLSPAGTTVRVSGKNFDVTKGIYVAFCVAPKPGQAPGPCGGGMTTTGASDVAHWISSNPPPYGVDLAEPFGKNGRFSVRLRVSPTIDTIDCRATVCGIATRADHTRSTDRSQDVFVPVTFASAR